MKKLGVFAVVLAVTAVTANAAIYTTVAQGALQLKLTIYPDGTATFSNTTGGIVYTDSYEIWSAGGRINPSPTPTGPPENPLHGLDPNKWISFVDSVQNDMMNIYTTLGAGVLQFGELTNTTTLIAEGSLSSSATFGAATTWNIGTLVNTVAQGDVTFYYGKSTTPGDKYLGALEVIPEPATMSLLAIGGLALLARRRR